MSASSRPIDGPATETERRFVGQTYSAGRPIPRYDEKSTTGVADGR